MPFLRFIRHLRLPFQFVLAPVFFLGYAPRRFTAKSADSMVVLVRSRCFIWGSHDVWAYNSYWDKDFGPICGMKHPLGVGRWELRGGLLVQAAAVWDLSWTDGRMGMVALLMLVRGIAYLYS